MSRTFRSRRSYHPSYSLLGRAVRTWVDDRLRGEALYIVVLTGLTLTLLMGHYLGWALLQPFFADHPSWQVWFWGGQVISVLVLAAGGLVGFRPPVHVKCTPEAVELRQGSRSCVLPYSSLDDVEPIPAVKYHRHYRRYATTQVFVSQLPNEVLLLHSSDGPVVVALSDTTAQASLCDHLQPEPVSAFEPVAQPEA